MATAASQKFSTRVKVPHLEGKGAHGDTHFVSSTHFNIQGKEGSRTSVIRYKGEWYVCKENPGKVGSFVQGDRAKPAQIPADAPKAQQTPKQPATKAAKTKAAKTPKKKSAKAKAARTKNGTTADAKVADGQEAGRQVA
jgi:glucan-binding YG repeat protein